jgi:hypothetical protein
MAFALFEASKKMKKPPAKDEPKELGPNDNPHQKGTMAYALFEAS